MTPNFYSQFGEDRWLYESSLLPEVGYFCDIGCSDPFIGSNTAFLRELGWTGLSIDALDYSAEYAAIGAKFAQAVVSTSPTVLFFAACNPLLARVSAEGQEVQAKRLDGLLIEHGIVQVDLLSLDCEGHEYEALMSGQWMIPPKIIIAEFLTASMNGGPDIRDERVSDYLLDHGYGIVWSSCSNHIYLRN